jgi:hypothetical protein
MFARKGSFAPRAGGRAESALSHHYRGLRSLRTIMKARLRATRPLPNRACQGRGGVQTRLREVGTTREVSAGRS